MQYQKTGSGEAVVLIHGYCETAHVWDSLLPLLPANYTWLIPELDGYGSPITGDITIDGYAAGINAILEKENITSCIFAGHSMGGYIALACARLYREKVKGLCILHSHPFGDNDAKRQGRYKSIDFLKKNGAEKYIPEFAANLFADTSPKEMKSKQYETVKNIPAETLIASLQAMATRQADINVLKNIHLPVLFIFGRQDKVMPLQDLLKQVPLPEFSQVHILEKSGHMGMIEETEVFAGYMKDYLKLLAANSE